MILPVLRGAVKIVSHSLRYVVQREVVFSIVLKGGGSDYHHLRPLKSPAVLAVILACTVLGGAGGSNAIRLLDKSHR
jgi:hypothetical protein